MLGAVYILDTEWEIDQTVPFYYVVGRVIISYKCNEAIDDFCLMFLTDLPSKNVATVISRIAGIL